MAAYWAWPLDYFGSDDHVLPVAQVRAARGEKRLDCLECLLWRVDGAGRLAAVSHMALDEKAWDAFFGAEWVPPPSGFARHLPPRGR